MSGTSKSCAEATAATVAVPSPDERGKKRAAPDIKEEDSVVEPSTSTGIVKKTKVKTEKTDNCDEENEDEQDKQEQPRKKRSGKCFIPLVTD